MALDEHSERLAIQQRLAKQLAKNPELKSQFDELERLLSGSGSLRNAGEIIVQRILGGTPTSAMNDGKEVLENETWNQLSHGWHGESHMRPKNWPIIKQIRRRRIISKLVKSISNAVQTADKTVERADARIADDAHRRNIRTFIATNAAILGKEKGIEGRINALLSDPNARLQAIGTRILNAIDHGTPTTAANPAEQAVIEQVLEKLKSDDNLENAFDGSRASNTMLLNTVQEIYKTAEARRNEEAQNIKRHGRGRVQKLFRLNSEHTRGLQEVRLKRGGKTKIETQKPLKVKPDKFKAPKRRTIEIPSEKFSGFETPERETRGNSGESLWRAMGNTFKLDESKRAPDEFNPATWEKIIFPVVIAHAIAHYGRRAVQFLIRNGLVRPANFTFNKAPRWIWNKILKKPLSGAGHIAAEGGRYARRLAYFATYPATLGIIPLLRNTVLKQKPGEKSWRKIRPYKRYRDELKTKRNK